MAKQSSTAKKTAASDIDLVQQVFKVLPATYRKVRLLAAARRGTGRPSSGQDIYSRALEEYLERNAKELETAAMRTE